MALAALGLARSSFGLRAALLHVGVSLHCAIGSGTFRGGGIGYQE